MVNCHNKIHRHMIVSIISEHVAPSAIHCGHKDNYSSLVDIVKQAALPEAQDSVHILLLSYAFLVLFFFNLDLKTYMYTVPVETLI